jgi:hypothetical protein
MQKSALHMMENCPMDTPNTTTHMTTSLINEIINSGYGCWVTERLEEGWEGYLITLMFKSLKGSRESVIKQMAKEVERVYATVLTRIIREPAKTPLTELPLWIACPDFPVPKHAKTDLRDVIINGGLHFHGIALIPPWSRMNCGVDEHFELSQGLYVRANYPLSRVHAVPITHDPEDVVGYGLKALARRRLDFDHVLILPRSHFEMPAEAHQVKAAGQRREL